MRFKHSLVQEYPLLKLDTSTAHSARVWNYLLSGKDNFIADRAAGDEMKQAFPGIVQVARGHRRFLAQAVRYLAADAGVRQFLDIGTGIPTPENAHQIAQRIAPQSRVVYVDYDPLVLVHVRALLTSLPGGRIDYVEADVRDPGTILADAAETLDFTKPTAVIMLGILGEIPDSDGPGSIVAALLDRLPVGSYLALSDATDTNPAFRRAIAGYNATAASPYHLRSPERLASFFTGLEMIPPGLVAPSLWRSGLTDASDRPAAASGRPAEASALCGIGRKA
jgi:hypothetical protein